jgi:hypothetical protein
MMPKLILVLNAISLNTHIDVPELNLPHPWQTGGQRKAVQQRQKSCIGRKRIIHPCTNAMSLNTRIDVPQLNLPHPWQTGG